MKIKNTGNRLSTFLLFSLTLFILTACDGKPPKSVEEKLITSSQKKPDELEQGLFNKYWSADSLWQKGTIERVRYEIQNEETGERYEEIWETRQTRFSKQHYSESNDTTRKDLFSAMSLSRQRISTPENPQSYSLQVSILSRDYFEPVRLQYHGFENGRMISKVLKRLMGRTVIYTHSYQGDFGDGEIELAKEIFLEEQLPLSLRGINFNLQIQGGINFYRSTYTSLWNFSHEAPIIREVEYKVESIDSLQLNGTVIEAIPISAYSSGTGGVSKVDRYWFDAKFPYTLLQAEWESGLTLKILSKEYLAPRK